MSGPPKDGELFPWSLLRNSDSPLSDSTLLPGFSKICAKLKEAFQGSLKGILGNTDKDLVSSDYIGDDRYSIFDANAGIRLSKTSVQLVSW